MVVCDVCSLTESTLSSLCQLGREEGRELFTPAESRSLNKGRQQTQFPQHSREGGGKRRYQLCCKSANPLGTQQNSPSQHPSFQCQAAHMKHISLFLPQHSAAPFSTAAPLPFLPTHLRQGQVVAFSE